MLRGWGKVGWGEQKVFETRVTSDQGNAGN